MRKRLPKRGWSWTTIERSLSRLAKGDIDWRHGRVPIGVIYVGNDVNDVAQRVYTRFFTESTSLAKRAFFSIERMEREVLDMGLELFNAPEGALGSFTTGGSESIILATHACRKWARDTRRNARPFNIVVPWSAHPAFAKACTLLDLEERRVPVSSDFRADVDAMARGMDENTIMLVASVPCFPYGMVDPVRALGKIAIKREVWLHVDACGGGYFAPFAQRLGYPLPNFDFAVPGVRSISADLHKLGYCPKPASTIYYRCPEDYERQVFSFDDWPNGRFRSPNLSNTRPGGSVAAAWAVMHYLGEKGYLRLAGRTMRMVSRYRDGINAIDGVEELGEPDLTVLAYGSRELDIYTVAERMQRRGWMINVLRQPRAIHNMLTLVHEPALKDYLRDLEEAVKEARAGIGSGDKVEATY